MTMGGMLMDEGTLERHGLCPSCRQASLEWCGIRVPSETKKAVSRREIQCDYILRCPWCEIRVFVPELGRPPEGREIVSQRGL
jgi:hypothetical protein